QPAPVSGDLIRQLGTRVSLSSAALSPDGNTAVAVSSSVLHVWDLKAGRQLRGVGGGTVYQEVVFLPDGRRLLARGGRVADGKFEPALQLVDSQTGQRLREFTGHTKAIQCMAISPDGRLALSGSGGPVLENGKQVTIDGQPVFDDCVVRVW